MAHSFCVSMISIDSHTFKYSYMMNTSDEYVRKRKIKIHHACDCNK